MRTFILRSWVDSVNFRFCGMQLNRHQGGFYTLSVLHVLMRVSALSKLGRILPLLGLSWRVLRCCPPRLLGAIAQYCGQSHAQWSRTSLHAAWRLPKLSLNLNLNLILSGMIFDIGQWPPGDNWLIGGSPKSSGDFKLSPSTQQLTRAVDMGRGPADYRKIIWKSWPLWNPDEQMFPSAQEHAKMHRCTQEYTGARRRTSNMQECAGPRKKTRVSYESLILSTALLSCTPWQNSLYCTTKQNFFFFLALF